MNPRFRALAQWTLCPLALVSLVMPGFAATEGVAASKVFKVGSQKRLTVRADLGTIEVYAGEADTAQVEVVYAPVGSNGQDNASSLNVDFTQNDDELRVEARLKPHARPFPVQYRISVPRGFAADLSTSGGNIAVRDLAGSVQVKTSGGNLTLSRIGGAVSASTDGGNIDVEEPLGGAKARTSGGGITVHLAGQPRKDVQLTTFGGNLVVVLGAATAVDVDAVAHGGTITAPAQFRLRSDKDATELSGALNGGGPQLTLRSSGGNISLRKGE
jgi:hypothetical protein